MEGTWQEIDEQGAVEAAIMNNNAERFNLTLDTPLMQQYMVEQLGYMARTPAAQKILQGQYTYDGKVDAFTNQFFQLIGERQQLQPLDISVSTGDFVGYWKGCRERTSSSPSQRYFGHYKAAAHSSTLSGIHSLLSHVAMAAGVPLSRWSMAFQSCLRKYRL